MSTTLRVALLIGSFLFVALVFSRVTRKKLQLGDCLLWLFVSFILILVAIFPQLCVWVSKLIGIETPSNFIYLITMAALLALTFHLTVQHSRIQGQIRRLIQLISIENYLREKREEGVDETK